MPKPVERLEIISVLDQSTAWFGVYNNIHPLSGLRMRSPCEFIVSKLPSPAERSV
jgi:putative transposase